MDCYISKYEAVAKFSVDGQPLWYRTSGVGNINDSDTDSTGNVYIVSSGGYVAKFNENGALIWSIQISGMVETDGIHLSQSDEVYVAGSTSSGNPVIVKLTSSGVVTWARHITSVTGLSYSISSNISDNRVYLSLYSIASSIFESYIIAFDSSGNTQWQRKVAFPSNNRAFMRSVSAYSGYVYAGVSLGYYAAAIYKWTKDGSYQFGVYIADPSFFPWPSIATGSDGSMFVTQYDGSMNKFDSNGALQWGRKFVVPGRPFTAAFGSNIDANGDVYYNGFTGNFQGSIFAKLKGDGSGVGYYNSDLEYSSSYTTGGYVDSIVNQYVSTSGVSISSYSCSASNTSISPVTSLPPTQYHALRTF
jgi:hypothetical protein